MFDEEFLLSFSRLCRLDYLEGKSLYFLLTIFCLFVFVLFCFCFVVCVLSKDQIELHIIILSFYHYFVFYAHMMCY